MTETTERVARALYRLRSPSMGPRETSEDRGWHQFAADAKCAIDAMPVEPHWRLTSALEECIWFIDHMPVVWTELSRIKATLKAAQNAALAESPK